MTEELALLRRHGIAVVTDDEIPQPIDTLKEIKSLYNIIKVHLVAVINEEIDSGDLNVKDVVTLGREMQKLNEMLFVFKVKLGELESSKKPKNSEIVMEMVGDLSERERLKISELLNEKIKLSSEAEENDGKTS